MSRVAAEVERVIVPLGDALGLVADRGEHVVPRDPHCFSSDELVFTRTPSRG